MIKKFLFFFNKNQKKNLLILLSFMLIATALEMVGLGFIFTIVGTLGNTTGKSNLIINNLSIFFELDKVEIFSYILLAFLLFYIIKISFLIFYNWFEGNFLFSYKENLSSKVFQQYLNQDLSYFYNRNSSEFIRNLNTEIDQFNVYLIHALKLFLEVTVLVGIFFFLSYINFYFTALVSIIFILISSLYFFLFKNKLNTWGVQRQTNTQKRIQFIQEGFDGIKIIKLLGRENFFFSKFKFHNINLSNIAIKTYFFGNLPKLLLEFVGILLVTISVFFLYYSGKSLIDITQLVSVYIAASFRILPSINRIVSGLQLIKLNYPAMDLLYNEIQGFKKTIPLLDEKFSFNKKIDVDIKKFKYPNAKNFKISDIKFNILKGQKIGIIGSSGSGKSTIIEIITGVLKSTAGDIIVDGKSIFSNLRGWQNLIGFVPQKIFILDESLRNNILFGLDNKKYSDDKILSLIQKLSLEKLLNRLPNELDGNLGEEGVNLSGGEIQRIGLCRALIYDPEVLFLDEATSSLDTITESQVLDELKQFKEKTIISIAHRLSSLKNSNMIYSINNGKLTDAKTYEKLII